MTKAKFNPEEVIRKKYKFKAKKIKGKYKPRTDGIFFHWEREFGKVRKLYKIACALFQNFHFMVKWILKRHDLLASNDNINPELWNQQTLILRNSYEVAFEVWAKHFMYNERRVLEGMSEYKTRDECYDLYYAELSQKSLRFLIDLLCTMWQEDTIYRELFNIWMFEIQFQMNAKFNPKEENKHVFYCNYIRNDPTYFNLMEEIGKGKTMQGKFHQRLGEKSQEYYGIKRMKLYQDYYDGKQKELNENLKDVKD